MEGFFWQVYNCVGGQDYPDVLKRIYFVLRTEICLVIRKREVSVGEQLFSHIVINVDLIFCHGCAVREEWQVAGRYYLLHWHHGQSLRRGSYIFIARKIITDLVVILFEVPKN